MNPVIQKAYQKAIKNRDVKFLVKHKFGYDLTPGQVNIVRMIAFREKKRISISATTRYGKTRCVSLGIALMIDLTKPTDKFIPKIAFIGPKQEQAGILREYMTELIFNDPSLLSKAMLTSKGDERIITESSRKKMTFSTGPVYRVFSAEGEAYRFMGFGANVIVPDDACLINRSASIKYMRMLGDAPDDAMLIELMNPWDIDNKAYDHSISDKFETIHIDYHQAIKEGRTTKEHIEEMADECGGYDSLEFTVLYKSNFPEMSEDALFSAVWIRNAMLNKFTLWEEVLRFRKELYEAEKINPTLATKLREVLKEYKIIIACDPADKGKDRTVIYSVVQHGNLYQKIGCYWEAKSDNQDIASKMYEIHQEIIATHWNVDGHGLGIGVLSRLKRIKRDLEIEVYIKSCLHGGKVIGKDKRKYKKQKAVNHFRLRRILKEGRFDLSEPTENKKLLSQGMKMKWKRNLNTELIQIIDPGEDEADKTKRESPDYVHALEYAIWEDKGEISSVSIGV